MKLKEALVQHFEEGCKEQQKIGLELEHFIVDKDTKESIPYEGDGGIQKILEEIEQNFTDAVYEEDSILGVYNDDYSISLEPGSQFEISVFPKKNIEEIGETYRLFSNMMAPILEKYNYAMVTSPIIPKTDVKDVMLIPKKRYQYMDDYFKTTGEGGIYMMRGTASCQVSVDYENEKDFVRKYRALNLLTPILLYLTDNSTSEMFNRQEIWENVDRKRTGIPNTIFEKNFGFQKYADYIMNLPAIFVPKKDDFIYTGDTKIRDLWRKYPVTKRYVDHYLSMAFPDVRLKSYLEIRIADSMPIEKCLAYCEIIKEMIYNPKVVDYVLNTFPWNAGSIKRAQSDVIRKHKEAMVYGMTIDEIMERLGELIEED